VRVTWPASLLCCSCDLLTAVGRYALGMMLAQLWGRQEPFKGANVHRIMALVLAGKRPDHLLAGTGAASKPKNGSGAAAVEEAGETGGGGAEAAEASTAEHRRPSAPAPLAALVAACWAQAATDRPPVAQVFADFDNGAAAAVAALKDDISGRPAATAPIAAATKGATAGGPATGAAEARSVSGGGGGGAGGSAVVAFLRGCGVEKHAAALHAAGFVDLETVCDKELLDDETLVKVWAHAQCTGSRYGCACVRVYGCAWVCVCMCVEERGVACGNHYPRHLMPLICTCASSPSSEVPYSCMCACSWA